MTEEISESSSTLDRVLAANRRYANGSAPTGLPRPPARHLIVITCMDARIDPFRALGLRSAMPTSCATPVPS